MPSSISPLDTLAIWLQQQATRCFKQRRGEISVQEGQHLTSRFNTLCEVMDKVEELRPDQCEGRCQQKNERIAELEVALSEARDEPICPVCINGKCTHRPGCFDKEPHREK